MDLATLVPGRQPKSYNRPARGRRVIGSEGEGAILPPLQVKESQKMILKLIILGRKSGVALL